MENYNPEKTVSATTRILKDVAPRSCPEILLRTNIIKNPCDNGHVSIIETDGCWTMSCSGYPSPKKIHPCMFCGINKNKDKGGVSINLNEIERAYQGITNKVHRHLVSPNRPSKLTHLARTNK